ncbi:MAG: hydrogenase 3 maturation endopeptidase HyCI [Methanomicrobium sp.]|nr:hydrogenase 3 maturation endopeptidase HyCI [Methanomicrobium sp.]MDD4300602.1 hydrogenase 3 maturation endopeptidase HyCI [Methanomicrobium sp.]
MNILLGVGNTLKSDDGAGVYVAQNFEHPGWTAYSCETSPENFTGIIRREKPKILIIVDAAYMGLSPGEFRIIPPDRLGVAGFDTHVMDLGKLIQFLQGLAGEIILLGIEPENTEFGDIISDSVIAGADRLIDAVKKGPGLISVL